MKPLVLCLIPLLLLLSACAPAARPPVQTEPELPVPTELPPETLPAVQEAAATEPADPAQQLLSWMTLEERVGQLFLARCPEENALEDALALHLGGFILFSRDFSGQTPESLCRTLQSWQSAVTVPLLIAVDEEGGTVCRVSSSRQFRDTPFSSPRQLYALGGMEAVLHTEEEKAALLASLGINVNMAPVCDVTTAAGSFLYSRSLGESPQITGDFAAAAVEILSRQQVGSVLKHFPGYGNNADTHTGIVCDRRSLAELEEQDLIPFRRGIEAGCGAVLMSHMLFPALDDTLPVSLSPAAHAYLRQELGFSGVIVTDDLAMGAITDAYGAEEAAVLAVLAGNDLLCATDYPVQYRAVLAAVESGRISPEQLDEAVLRVLRWKASLGLLTGWD